MLNSLIPIVFPYGNGGYLARNDVATQSVCCADAGRRRGMLGVTPTPAPRLARLNFLVQLGTMALRGRGGLNNQ